jgi:hypothetical protein
MNSEVIVAVIGLVGVILGAIPTYLFMQRRNTAEIEKTQAETEKTKAEAEKIRNDMLVKNTETPIHQIEHVKEIKLLKEELRHQHSLLVYLHNLHKVKYKLDYWKVSYSITENGNVHTTEEMCIRPTENGQVFFRRLILGITPNTNQEIQVQKFHAINKTSKQRLEFIQITKNQTSASYAIILDPPATIDKPTEILIENYRPKVFAPLITDLKDQGGIHIQAANKSNVEISFTAPPNISFTSFSMSPNFGMTNVNDERILWKGTNAPDGKYSYTIQAKRRV